MGIKNIGARSEVSSSKMATASKATKEKFVNACDKVQAKSENEKAKVKSNLEGLAHSVKALPLNIKKKQDLAQIAHKEAFRKESLVAEARSNGVNKKEAQKGAEALMCATGTHTHKSAEESANVFEKVGKTKAEYAADTVAHKEALKEKFNK